MNIIAFVGDDPEVSSPIATYLTRHDVEVILELCGDLAEGKILHVQPDLVLLDTMLLGRDGMITCRDLHGRWQGPIILLTLLDSDINHILALEMNVCDYTPKAAPPAMLLVRLHLHLRQDEHSAQSKSIQAVATTPCTMLHFGTFTVDPANRSVLLGDEQISLSIIDFELPWELAAHAGQIMDRDALLKNLHGVNYGSMDRSVDIAISRLHKKLFDSAAEPYRIKTVRSKDYLFTPHAWDDRPQK